LAVPTGKITLAFCVGCGLIFNQSYLHEAIAYNQEYENSLHFSERFNEYIRSLARDLIERFNLRNKDVIEIGCGKGDFLALLCEAGNNRGVGFDPSFEQERLARPGSGRLRIIADFYSEAYAHLGCDFLCCRQTLEHIPQPVAFLRTVRRALGASHERTVVFFEVPNALYTFRHMGVWDIIYEHVTYFWSAPLRRLFDRSGFRVLSVRESYGSQFLCVEAVPGPATDTADPAGPEEMAEVTEEVRLFGQRFRSAVDAAATVLDSAERQKQRIVLWGAGSKGVTFLNIFKDRSVLEYAVDVNPHKQGKFVPGTGHAIVPPAFLSEYRPDMVLVMNPLYRDEIAGYLLNLSIPSRLVVV
jgi:SAM-dependent methyltransferase